MPSSLSWILPFALVVESQALQSSAMFSAVHFWVIPAILGMGFISSQKIFVSGFGRLRFNFGGAILPVLFSLVALPSISLPIFLLSALLASGLFSLSFRQVSVPRGVVNEIRYSALLGITIVAYLLALYLTTPGLFADPTMLTLGRLVAATLTLVPAVTMGAFVGDVVSSARSLKNPGISIEVGAFGLRDVCWSVLSEFLILYGILLYVFSNPILTQIL